MELGTRYFEDKAPEFFKKANKKGLLRWRMNRVWNKQSSFTISQVYEHKEENAFKNCQIVVDEFYETYKKDFSLINAKIVSSRAITILDYVSEDY